MSAQPTTVGFIVDGNRRWARERNLPTLEGHRRGFERFKEIVLYGQKRGLKHIVGYLFSTENWHRSPEEVSYLMDLFRHFVSEYVNELDAAGIRIRIIGQKERFPKDIQDAMKKAEEKTKHHQAMTLWLALSYGGRAEIVVAANKAIAVGKPLASEDDFAQFLWTAELPDPDLVIRTGGEKRLSNFLLWSLAYSELFFVPQFFPDFTPKDFDAIVEEYGKRHRRHGR